MCLVAAVAKPGIAAVPTGADAVKASAADTRRSREGDPREFKSRRRRHWVLITGQELIPCRLCGVSIPYAS